MNTLLNARLAERLQSLTRGEHVVTAGFLGSEPVVLHADGRLVAGRAATIVEAGHPDAVVTAAAWSAEALVWATAGGKVLLYSGGAGPQLVGQSGGWIDAVALGPDGAIGWVSGREVTVQVRRGVPRKRRFDSGVRGLAFMPKGLRIAVAHNGGASLWFPNSEAAPEPLPWKGSHLDIVVSPDGRYVITAMQENALHGWRIADRAHMRMTGYPARTRSLSWSADGLWLATSGAEAAIIWPFAGRDGPMGKAPRECGARRARVSVVAFHPANLVLAIGYEDGAGLLVRLTDGAELTFRAPDGGAVSALAWSRDGRQLIIGTAAGTVELLEMP